MALHFGKLDELLHHNILFFLFFLSIFSFLSHFDILDFKKNSVDAFL